MNKLAMRYSVIRFMPYVQTREFANIGVILICPKTGFFNYKIENRYQRLSNFFKYFDANVYKHSLQAFSSELERIKNDLNNGSSNPTILRTLFEHLTRPRDTIIFTSEVGVTTGINEQVELENLFKYFAEHSFAKELNEEIFTKKIQEMIKGMQPIYPFIKDQIGTDQYQAAFPLIQKNSSTQIRKIIKPLYLGQHNPSDIIKKSDKWINTIQRLRSFETISSNTEILFPFESSPELNPSQSNAFELIFHDAKKAGIKLVDKNDINEIKEFATT